MAGLAFLASAGLAGIALGAGSALWTIRRGMATGQRLGPWRHNPLVGATGAGPYLRARVAAAGFLALNRSEALYLVAMHDDAGEPLRAENVYRVEGGELDARWWSLTVYGPDRFLIPNPEDRYSYENQSVTRDAAGRYRIQLSHSTQPGDWIPLPERGPFDLTLRLYRPSAALRERIAGDDRDALPSIRRVVDAR